MENFGTKTIDFTGVRVTADGAEMIGGDENTLGSIKTEKKATLEAMFLPSAEGEVHLTIELDYRSDLNAIRTLRYNYTVQAKPPVETEVPLEPVVEATPEVVKEDTPDDLIGRLLLGFFGLGG
ncbi:MAG: hypothetical protein IPK19_37360 [Chloroflexi bacterium]|nr:hypothetical protein [Chloroflexota bacterium]